MTTAPLTADALIQKIVEIGHENPTFVYPQEWNVIRPITGTYADACEYRHPDDTDAAPKGACIVGQAFVALGHGHLLPERGHSVGVTLLLRRLDVFTTHEQARVLGGIQSRQDAGETWGEAVDAALAEHAPKTA